MFCPHCGHAILACSTFCAECGVKVPDLVSPSPSRSPSKPPKSPRSPPKSGIKKGSSRSGTIQFCKICHAPKKGHSCRGTCSGFRSCGQVRFHPKSTTSQAVEEFSEASSTSSQSTALSLLPTPSSQAIISPQAALNKCAPSNTGSLSHLSFSGNPQIAAALYQKEMERRMKIEKSKRFMARCCNFLALEDSFFGRDEGKPHALKIASMVLRCLTMLDSRGVTVTEGMDLGFLNTVLDYSAPRESPPETPQEAPMIAPTEEDVEFLWSVEHLKDEPDHV